MNPTAEAMRRAILASGLPHRRLAARAGVSYAALHAWLHGIRRPGAESVTKIADALDEWGGSLAEIAEELRRSAR